MIGGPFTRRAKLTIPAAQVGAGGVSNYSIVITEDMISSDHAIWTEAQVDGGDIRASLDEAGDTQLSLDLIEWDTVNKVCQIGLGLVSLSSVVVNEFYLWWDFLGVQSQPAPGDPFGQYSAYDSSLKGYFPLEEDPSVAPPQILDRTSNMNHGTTSGTMLTEDLVDSQVGNGLELDGIDDWIDISGVGDYLAGEEEITCSLWAKSVVRSGYMVSASQYTGWDGRFEILLRNDAVHLQFYNNAASAAYWWVGEYGDYSLDVWHHIVAVKSDTQLLLYVDNDLIDTTNYSTAQHDPMNRVHIGQNVNSTNRFQGCLDAVSYRLGAWSQADVTTYFNNTNDPNAFAELESAVSIGVIIPSLAFYLLIGSHVQKPS